MDFQEVNYHYSMLQSTNFHPNGFQDGYSNTIIAL